MLIDEKEMIIKIFVQLMNNKDLYDEDINFDLYYSGRGMYGRTCIGISGAEEDILVTLTRATCMYAIENKLGNELLNILLKTILNYKKDNLGLDMILYWPRIEWNDDYND